MGMVVCGAGWHVCSGRGVEAWVYKKKFIDRPQIY